jgi:circularin A/uberolysin family circular bacteriocin
MAKNRSISPVTIAVTGTLSLAGLLSATLGVMIVAGMFGISTALASQIINAVSVGGWLLAVIFAALSGGIAGLSIALIRGLITRYGKALAAT